MLELQGFAHTRLLRCSEGRYEFADIGRQRSSLLPCGRQCPPRKEVRAQFGI